MKQLIAFGIILFLLPVSLKAQKGYTINVNVYNYQESELTLAYYLGDKQYIKQTATKGANGSFVFKGDTALHCGLYMLVTKPKNDFVEFIVPADDQLFSLSTDYNNMAETFKADGSAENKVFHDYLNFMRIIRAASDSLDKTLEEDNSKAELIETKRASLDKKMKQYKNALYVDHKDKLCVALIKSSEEPELPEFTGTEQDVKNKQFYWYRQHYFDLVDFSNPCLFYSPVLFNRVKSYMNDLTIQQPDSINKSLDVIFSKAASSNENLKFIAIHYLNEYAKSQIVGFDACYVHIANKLYCNGKADWVNAEQLKKICENAKKLEPVLIGKKAPDFTMQDSESKKQKLSDIKADYLVLFFWDSKQSSRSKGAADLIQVAKKYKANGAKIFTLYTNYETESSDYNRIAKEIGFTEDNFINASVLENSQTIKDLYDIKNLPSIYVLNKDQKIISKRIGSEQLSQILDYELKK